MTGLEVRAPAVQLDAAAANDTGAEAPAAKWVQIGYEGHFEGHVIGPFDLTRAKFEEAVANFRKHPAYKQGATMASADQINAGNYDVVPWDFHHASEQAPTSGTIPTEGAPAQGWALELEVRNGPDGKAQLWSFTRFLEPLKGYMLAGKYKWCSMTLYLEATHPTTGKKIGAYLSSVAATNDPFLQGMVPLAASRQGPKVQAGHYYYDPYNQPCTPEDAVEQIRNMLKLPETTGIADLRAELQKVQAWAAGTEAAPPGVEVDDLVGVLRRMINLPLTATSENVFASVFAVLDQAMKDTTAKPTEGTTDTAAPSEPAMAEWLRSMSLGAACVAKDLKPADLSALRRLSAVDAQKELESKGVATIVALELATELSRMPGNVVSTERDHMDPKLLALVATKLGIPSTAGDVEKQIVIKLEQGQDAMTKLEALLTALEVEDVPGATKKIVDLVQKAAKLEEVMPELGQLREMKAKGEEAAMEQQVDQAMAAHRIPANMRKSLMLHRKSDPEGFAKEFPLPDAAKAYLTRPIVTGNGTGAPVVAPATLSSTSAVGVPSQGAQAINLSQYPGVNDTQRVHAYLESTLGDSFKKLTRDERFALGRKTLAQLKPNTSAARPF